jgi:hypothetical protein
MMIRRSILCAITMCAISMSAIATLPPYDPVLVDEFSNELFAGSGSQAFVTSQVYKLDPAAGGYLYTYQISGATTKFTWFSVAFQPQTSIIEKGYEIAAGTINPFAWEPVTDGDVITSIEAFFKSGLTETGKSALLWYTSPNGPGPSLGALAKLSLTGGGAYAEGLVLVPTPEPMTAGLLGLGWLVVRSYRRK